MKVKLWYQCTDPTTIRQIEKDFSCPEYYMSCFVHKMLQQGLGS